VREQTGIVILPKNLKKVTEHRYVMVGGLHVCNIFLTCVHDIIPVHESLENDMWKKFDYKELDKLDYQLIYSLRAVYDDIKYNIRSLRINNRSMKKKMMNGDNKKRARSESDDDDSSDDSRRISDDSKRVNIVGLLIVKMKEFNVVELLGASIPTIRPKETKLIIVTGAIAMARTLDGELRLYQGDSKKYAFFFQTYLDTILFTNVMIPDEDGEVLKMLDDELNKLEFPFDVAKVIYLKPSCDKMLERYRIRELNEYVKGDGVDVGYDDDYLIAIYDQYDLCMEKMYSSYMMVVNDDEGYDAILNQIVI
ncbi:6032_t:CDS:2, partial [Acaulospora morrowiae]